jgi:serine/threonine protein kinase/WD40 repeat protein
MSERELFESALELPPEDRGAFLDGACGPDAALRQRLEALLSKHEQAGSFLEEPAVPAPAAFGATAVHPPITEGPRTVIGPYRLMEQIGEGGFGLVFVAEQQDPVRRKVALKVIKPGMDTREVIARFEAERQALALMDHPNIAKVLDAGATDSGRPYFVMELVKGVPITDYCDQNQLTPRRRLELFVSVCQAVQHAHTKGVIHRDLKPSNILVTLHDDTPVVKVIDFGVAKALGQRLTDKTIYTRFSQMIGTPLYMSPEQAQMSGLDIDTRSDIYALAVLLYELLTGTTPFDSERLKKAALDEMRRIIREEEPPRPSTRLSTLGATLSAVSAKRNMEPGKLSALVKGDLDWIVMKGLDKDRTRRYETASAFAADVQRFLSEEPVEARPPSAGYRLRKFVRRNRGVVLAGAAVVLTLVAGIVGTTWGMVEALWQRDETELARKQEGEQRLAALANAQKAQENEQTAHKQRNDALAARDQARRTLYAFSMNLIQLAWEANNVPRVLELLDRQLPGPRETDLRGFEWHHLHRLCHADLRTLKFDGVWELSSDGSRCAAVLPANGQKPHAVKVWDLATGKERDSLPLDRYGLDLVDASDFSRDGKRLALMANRRYSPTDQVTRGRLLVWDLDTGKEILTLDGPFGYAMALSPDGGRLAAASGEPNEGIFSGVVKVWDVATGKVLAVLETGSFSLAFSPDGTRLAGAGFSGIRIADVTTGKILQSIPHPVTSVTFSPDGTHLAAAGVDRGPTGQGKAGGWVFDAATGKELVAVQSPGGAGRLVFSHDGRLLAGYSSRVDPWVVRIFDAATGEERCTLKGHTGRVSGMAFSPDDRRLYTAETNGTVKVWDATRDDRRKQPAASGPARIVRSPHSSREAVYTPARPGDDAPETDVIVRDLAGKELLRFKEHMAAVFWLRFSRDGRYVVSYDGAGGKKVWDAATGRVLLNLNQTTTSFLYLWPEPKQIHDRVTFRSSSGDRVGVAVSADDTRLAEFGLDGVRVRNLPGFEEVFAFKGPSDRVECSPDVLRIVTLDSAAYRMRRHGQFGPLEEKPPAEDRLRLWDVATGKEILDLQGTFSSPTFSPDGRRFAAIQHPKGAHATDLLKADNQVKVWDARTGAELATLTNNAGFGTSSSPHDATGALAFSPDGARLATIVSPTARPGEVPVWDVVAGKELFRLKGPAFPVEGVAFSPDGRRLATANARDEEPAVRLWDAATGSELLTLKAANARREAAEQAPFFPASFYLAFSRDGARLCLQVVPPGGGRRGGPGPPPVLSLIWDATPVPEKR